MPKLLVKSAVPKGMDEIQPGHIVKSEVYGDLYLIGRGFAILLTGENGLLEIDLTT